MRKIHNPYDQVEGHYCFACSKKNPIGLKLEFYEDGDDVISKWTPQNEYTGFYNVLHGGIQTVLMDEVAAWCVQIKHKTAGVTTKLEARYKKPVYIDKGEITLKSRILDVKRNIVNVKVELFDSDGQLCAEGDVQYYTFSQKVAQEKLHYPNYNSFFNKD